LHSTIKSSKKKKRKENRKKRIRKKEGKKERKKEQKNLPTAEVHATGRNTETQMTLHTCIKSGMDQNFRFSELSGFQNCP